MEVQPESVLQNFAVESRRVLDSVDTIGFGLWGDPAPIMVTQKEK
jgi:hypothetical protein